MDATEVLDCFDVGDFQLIAIAEEKKGLFGVFGAEFPVGGEVENAVVEEVVEGAEGEVLIEFGAALEESLGIGGADDRVEFIGDVG